MRITVNASFHVTSEGFSVISSSKKTQVIICEVRLVLVLSVFNANVYMTTIKLIKFSQSTQNIAIFSL